jgi:Ser/Thr protein kinase RdoA (MazF antagonist)
VPPGADRPAGALHHYAEGTMSDELRAAASWLDGLKERLPDEDAAAAVDELRAALTSADGGDGLPEALVHPDPVPKNAIFTAAGPVLVDWTSAGRGPRLASLSLVLRSGWAAAPFLRGYFKAITLTDAERDRLARVMAARALINLTFDVCHDPSKATAAARKLPAMRDQCEGKAAELLSTAPAT